MGLKARAAKHTTINAYNDAQGDEERLICHALRRQIDTGLADAESKIWHAHPVWFLDGNPIVGYGKLKDCIRLMFWSGQSFKGKGLTAEGSFKAAVARYTHASQIDELALQRWLASSRRIQWDYKNIVARRGELVRLR
tara:strand:- start:50783 stop:51196 length:414 start_codon:yes stop_codon:yes gene_type:complete